VAMEQAKRGADRVSGVPNVTYDLLAVLYNKLQGIAALEEYRQDARAAGDGEVDGVFAQLEQAERDAVERLRGLLATRMQQGAAWISTRAGQAGDRPTAPH
jgi:hypothetical protein